MTPFLDKVGRVLFPPPLRPYLTFRSATVCVVLLYVIAWLVKIRIGIPAERLAILRTEEQIFYSRGFLLIYNLALAAGFLAVYLTRHNPRIYFRRVLIYSVLLMAVCGELLDIFVPWRV